MGAKEQGYVDGGRCDIMFLTDSEKRNIMSTSKTTQPLCQCKS